MQAAADYLSGADEQYTYSRTERDAWLEANAPHRARSGWNRPTGPNYCAQCGENDNDRPWHSRGRCFLPPLPLTAAAAQTVDRLGRDPR